VFSTVLADVPIVIDRDDARRAAEVELSKADYQAAQPGVVERVLRWLGQRLADLFEAAAGVVPGGPLGLLVLLAVVVLVIVVVRLRVGKLARDVRASRPVFENRSASAADYRAAADQAVAAGDFAGAVRERFRAIVRGFEERGVLDEQSGRTADEAAREAGARFPAAREQLGTAAALFDAVHYGGRPASAEDHRRLAALEEQVSRGVLT